jgi:Tfp pilus assembly protein PilO
VSVKEDKKVNWKRWIAIAATGVLSIYTVATLQGPHGLGALQEKLARIQALREEQANLARAMEEKKRRVQSLERGQNIEMEMRRFGRTLPGEVEYNEKAAVH